MKPPAPSRFPRKGLLLAFLFAIAMIALLVGTRSLMSGTVESPSFNLQVILLTVLTVVNILALLLLVAILVRYVIKLFFDRRGKTIHTSVRVKLIFAFAMLAFIPTGFFIAYAASVCASAAGSPPCLSPVPPDVLVSSTSASVASRQ